MEALRGDRADRHGIRINAQRRICIRWTAQGPCDVEIVDCHREGTTMSARNGMRPVHPGEIPREELETIRLSANTPSKALDVPVNRIMIEPPREARGGSSRNLGLYRGSGQPAGSGAAGCNHNERRMMKIRGSSVLA